MGEQFKNPQMPKSVVVLEANSLFKIISIVSFRGVLVYKFSIPIIRVDSDSKKYITYLMDPKPKNHLMSFAIEGLLN